METGGSKWRYTSPTHTVRAFAQALDELDAEDGCEVRSRRYAENHRTLVDGMRRNWESAPASRTGRSPPAASRGEMLRESGQRLATSG